MTKITALAAATTPLDPTDLVEVVQNVATTPVNRKVPVSSLGGGGGGGGFTWVLQVDDPCSTTTDWTNRSGTWTSDGNRIIQSDLAAAQRRFGRTPLTVPAPWVLMESIIRFPSASQATGNLYGGIHMGPASGMPSGQSMVRIQRISGAWNVHWESDSVVGRGVDIPMPTAVGAALDVDMKLRVLYGPLNVAAWVNGLLIGTQSIDGYGDVRSPMLMTFGARVEFDNFKVWTPDVALPA